jgi:hypothetical protein
MWRRNKSDTVLAGLQDVAIGKRARSTIGEVVKHHDRSNNAAYRLRLRRNIEPFVQSAAFVRFEVAESNPAQLRGIHDRFNSFERGLKHSLETRMH